MKSAFNSLTQEIQKYLGLARKESSSAFKQERKRTKFHDVHRRISIYLRALWSCDFILQSSPPDAENPEGDKPYVEGSFIRLPDAYHDLTLDGVVHLTGLEIYRAASTHAAAHIMYTKRHFSAVSLNKWQQAVIATIEDARVETLAIQRFPGLKQLWTIQHRATPEQNKTAGAYLDRLARALLDENYVDDDPWIIQGRSLFNAVDDLENGHISWEIGMTLARSFRKKSIKFNVRSDQQSAPYRDDNSYLWKVADLDSGIEQELPNAFLRMKGALLESDDVVVVGDDSEKATEYISKEPEVGKPISAPYGYAEWDYQSQTETQSWVTLREQLPMTGDLHIIDNIIAQHNHLITRMKNLLNAIRHGGVRRIRKLEEGDEIDVNAAIRAQIDIRIGVQPDPRIMMRTLRRKRDISVLVLLDLSNSMNEKVKTQDLTVLQLTRQVCVLLADAIGTVGDPFAVHGFCSESRHFVEYFRLKDFDQPYDDVAKANIAGMTGQRATRMGAAIRHATYHLNKQKSGKKLLMFITDGAPSDVDVDVHGRDYLLFDTKKAVDDAGRSGIDTYCISLDPNADEYVSRIFGARNYIVVDHIKSLPEKMLLLYAGLTR